MSHILFMSSDPVLKAKNMDVLQQSGLEVSGVSECLQGLVALDKTEYDVVVIDDELSDMNGYEACLKVRKQSDVAIVLLGSVAESEVWSKVEELGFDLYLRKPVSPRELLARIKALLRRPTIEKKSLPSQQTSAQAIAQTPPLQPPTVQTAAQTHDASVQPPQPRVPSQAQTSLPQPAPMTGQVSPAQPEYKAPPQLPLQQQIPGHPQQVQAQSAQPFPVQPETAAPHVQYPPMQPQSQQPQPAPVQPAPLPPERQTPSSQTPQVTQQYREPQPVVVPPLEVRGSPPQMAAQPARQQVPLQPGMHETPAPEETGINVLEDARIIKLVDALVSGKLTDITPVVDFNYKAGYAYPAVDNLLDTSEQETVKILEALASSEILIKQPFEHFYVDPDGLFQLVPVEHCPRDDSSNLVKGQLVEHFSCGFVGLDRDFKQESRYICPKCHKDLRLIGTDYRNIGIHYRCQDCSEIFTAPVIKWRNLKTRREWNADELKEMEVYSYRFSPDKKGWLEFQLKPKTQLVDFLRLQSYQVQELVQLTGKSGAVHTFDILAIRDDVLTKINLGIGILVANTGAPEVSLESLFRFDTRAYDIGINYKVVIAIPRLGQEAINFANRQMIRAFEARTLSSVVSDITGSHPKISLQSNLEAGQQREAPATATGNATAVIARFLRNRGYEVFERALINGKSGVEHIFDIFARRDDKIIVPTIAVGIANSRDGQPVGMDELAIFDAAAFDSGIRNKVFLGLPQISVQARQFARQQRIDILEQQDLNKLM
jgi:DNA-binding NarL/FixJ family response regulator